MSLEYCAIQSNSWPSWLFFSSNYDQIRLSGDSHDEHGSLSRLALQALLHPTGFPEESRGPTSGDGHPGFRSTGHEATEQPLADGVTLMGMLNPSTSDTTNTSLSQSGRGVNEKNARAPS